MPHPFTSGVTGLLRGWGGDPRLRTLQHGLMAHRGLRGPYRHQAATRMVLAPAWAVALLIGGGPGVPGWLIVLSGVCATVGALAAWSHQHEHALDWMSDHAGMRRIARYLRRTARDRRVVLDVPGMIEGAGLLSMTAVTAAGAPGRRATVRALAEDPPTVGFTCRVEDLAAERLRPTDLAMLESVLSDLCANSVREANRLRCARFGLDAELRTDDTGDGCLVSVTVTDTGTGFTRRDILGEHSSLSVLGRRLRRRGGDLEIGTAPGGGACVKATWQALQVP